MAYLKPPSLWFRTKECWIVWSLIIGATLGGSISWYLSRELPPWLEFNELTATYSAGSRQIDLSGTYVVNRICPHARPLIWRTETLAADGQLTVYGPKPYQPPLTPGEHDYAASIQLPDAITPNGWVAQIIITCPGEMPETVASNATMVFVYATADPVERFNSAPRGTP